MRTHTMGLTALAGILAVGLTTGASAQSVRIQHDNTLVRGEARVESRTSRSSESVEVRREPRTTGSVGSRVRSTVHDDDFMPPGHAKRGKSTSARKFAPGHMDDESTTTRRR